MIGSLESFRKHFKYKLQYLLLKGPQMPLDHRCRATFSLKIKRETDLLCEVHAACMFVLA